MQRNRHDGIGLVEHVGAGEPHHASERLGQQSPVIEFEHVDELAQGAVVRCGAARDRKRWRALAAADAEMI